MVDRRRGSRVKINRKTVDQVRLAVADGAFAIAKAVVLEADPPDATPFGEGLVTTGGALAYVGPKKVAGWSEDGTQPKKPRAVRVRGTTDEIVAVGGFGFPALFNELGTVHQPARPFFLPAMNRVIPRAPGIMRQAAAYRIARLRSLGRA
jgi:hypothetical protein